MAALDDRYDVLDYCQKHGLNYDSITDQAIARERMYAEWREKHPDTRTAEELEAIREENRRHQASFIKLFKQRYGG